MNKVYRYYCLFRPPAPGAVPNNTDNRIVDVIEFDERKYCPDADCYAWGYVEYEHPLKPQEIVHYELMSNDYYIGTFDDTFITY